MTRKRGGSRKADGYDDYRREDFGQDDLGSDDFGEGELPETVPAAEWPVGATAVSPGFGGLAAQHLDGDSGGRRARRDQVPGDRRATARTGFGEQAPWDMVGDWGSGGRRDNADPWTQPAGQQPAGPA